MIHLLLVLGAFGGGAFGARFDYTASIGKTYYFDIPRSNIDALGEGWRLTPRPEGGPEGYAKLKLYCRENEYAFCVLYDDVYYVAGIQYALDQERFEKAYFDFVDQGFSEWTVEGKKYWAIAQYFVDEDHLKLERSARSASRTTATLQQDGIWVTTKNNTLLHVPGTAAGLESAGFVKQECVQGQGLHYLYQPSEIDCTTWLPWVPIVYNETLTGCIFANIGSMSAKPSERYYFENITPYALKASLPDIDQCVVDLATTNGVLSIHTFYFGNPWTVTCAPADGTP